MEAVGSFEAFVNLYPEDGGFVILRDNVYHISIRIYAIGSFENVSTFALIAEAVGFFETFVPEMSVNFYPEFRDSRLL